MNYFVCSEQSWHEIIRLSKLFKFQGLMSHVKDNVKAWFKFYDSMDPLHEKLPDSWDKLDGLERIPLLRCFRMDKVITTFENISDIKLCFSR